MAKSVYIHIPFCKNICSYCAFCKIYYNKQIVYNYLNSLAEEIELHYQKEKISTIYIGGGTPSDLDTESLQKLFDIIKVFNKEENCEITFECNINISKEKLIILKNNGVNRLSFGIQTISPKLLKIIDRWHSIQDIKTKISLCRKLGFNNINGDLIYALYDEDEKILLEDIAFLLSLNLEHISTYSLMIENHTKLYLKKYPNIDENKDLKMYQTIHKILTKNHYIHYEVSNFSKCNYQSKHNLVYWQNKEYYGFGLGASGYLNNIRYKNTESLSKYMKKDYRYEIEKLDKYDKMIYEVILGLRTKDGLDLNKFYKLYNQKFDEVFFIDDYLKSKYLIKKDKNIYIPFNKWYVMNYILERFVK